MEEIFPPLGDRLGEAYDPVQLFRVGEALGQVDIIMCDVVYESG